LGSGTLPSVIRPSRPDFSWSPAMMDIVMLAIAIAFFTVSIAYVHACDRL
jgi:hypothetical protein